MENSVATRRSIHLTAARYMAIRMIAYPHHADSNRGKPDFIRTARLRRQRARPPREPEGSGRLASISCVSCPRSSPNQIGRRTSGAEFQARAAHHTLLLCLPRRKNHRDCDTMGLLRRDHPGQLMSELGHGLGHPARLLTARPWPAGLRNVGLAARFVAGSSTSPGRARRTNSRLSGASRSPSHNPRSPGRTPQASTARSRVLKMLASPG